MLAIMIVRTGVLLVILFITIQLAKARGNKEISAESLRRKISVLRAMIEDKSDLASITTDLKRVKSEIGKIIFNYTESLQPSDVQDIKGKDRLRALYARKTKFERGNIDINYLTSTTKLLEDIERDIYDMIIRTNRDILRLKSTQKSCGKDKKSTKPIPPSEAGDNTTPTSPAVVYLQNELFRLNKTFDAHDFMKKSQVSTSLKSQNEYLHGLSKNLVSFLNEYAHKSSGHIKKEIVKYKRLQSEQKREQADLFQEIELRQHVIHYLERKMLKNSVDTLTSLYNKLKC